MLASGTGRQPIPCSAFVVFHHRDGLLLLDPLRVLHRSSSLGVRDVSSSTPLLSSPRVPALRSFTPCTQRSTRGCAAIEGRHPGVGPTSPEGLPCRHRLPCPLVLVAWTSRLFSVYRALSRRVLPPLRDRCSLGLVRASCCMNLEGSTIPALARRSRLLQLALVRHIRSG